MIRLGLYLGFPPEGGGTFQYAQTLLAAMAALPASDYDLVVAHSHAAWQSNLAPFGKRLHTRAVRRSFCDTAGRLARHARLPASMWRAMAPCLPTVERQLARLHCDWWIFPAQDYLAFSMRAQTIGTIHDLMHRYEPRFPEVGSRVIAWHREYVYRNMCHYAQALLVDSELGKQQVIESYAVLPFHVHELPFAAPAYLRRAPPTDFGRRYTLPDRFVFYPAQMWQHKNHMRLIRALAQVRRTLPNLNLVLAGSGQNGTKSIHRLVHELALDGAVHFLGYVPDDCMGELYRRARCLVMPSFFGPTNIPPLEAIVIGCPMALADVYAMREQSGDCALYFNPESVDDIASCMQTLVTDDVTRARLIAACAKRRDRFTQDAFNERFRGIMQEITPRVNAASPDIAKGRRT